MVFHCLAKKCVPYLFSTINPAFRSYSNGAPNASKTTTLTTIVTTNPSNPRKAVAVPVPSKAPASATTQLHETELPLAMLLSLSSVLPDKRPRLRDTGMMLPTVLRNK